MLLCVTYVSVKIEKNKNVRIHHSMVSSRLHGALVGLLCQLHRTVVSEAACPGLCRRLRESRGGLQGADID